MSLKNRSYRWAGGIAISVITLLILLNVFSVWKWPSLHYVQFESEARAALYSDIGPGSWVIERNKLLEEVAQLKGLADENNRLREALSFVSKKQYSYIVANSISRDPLTSSLVYLDVGSDDGVVVGQPVTVSNGTLIGKILKVTPKTALLELLTANSSRVAVKALTDSGTSGVLRGTLGSGARLEYIRDNNALGVGTILITSGLEPLIPQGLVVGTIQKIIENEDALFASAVVLPAADLSQLSIVLVLRGL
jgi:rod shape-determining protein MreC